MTCPNGCTVLAADDLPPLDPTVDYGRDLARADADRARQRRSADFDAIPLFGASA